MFYKLKRNFVTARTFFGFILDIAFRISLVVNGIVIRVGGMIVLGCLFLYNVSLKYSAIILLCSAALAVRPFFLLLKVFVEVIGV